MQAEHPTGVLPVKCLFLTQADDGPKAINFWLKQTLTQGAAAKSAMESMHDANSKQNVWYNNATPMMCELNSQTLRVEESRSERAQNVPEAPARTTFATPQDGAKSDSEDEEGRPSPRRTRTTRRQSIDTTGSAGTGEGGASASAAGKDDEVTGTPQKQRVRSPIATRGSRSKGGRNAGLGKWAHLVQVTTP